MLKISKTKTSKCVLCFFMNKLKIEDFGRISLSMLWMNGQRKNFVYLHIILKAVKLERKFKTTWKSIFLLSLFLFYLFLLMWVANVFLMLLVILPLSWPDPGQLYGIFALFLRVPAPVTGHINLCKNFRVHTSIKHSAIPIFEKSAF